jgi:hypothetical protein
MKISFGIIVVDGMPFMKHQLRLIYPHAHEIIICEGGDDTWEGRLGYRHSQDGTVDFIKSFPDPDKKITLIQTAWKDKNHMCHEYSRWASGEIVWHIDVDEFVDPAHFPYLISLFERHGEYDAMAIPQIVFWGDTETIIGAQFGPGPEWSWEWPGVDRIYRTRPGTCIHHIPERGYYDPIKEQVTPVRHFPGEVLGDEGIYTYHFSYVLPRSVEAKMKYYNERVQNCIDDDWYRNVFMRFRENREHWIDSHFDVQPVNHETKQNYPWRINPLHRPLPGCLKELEEDISRELESEISNARTCARCPPGRSS